MVDNGSKSAAPVRPAIVQRRSLERMQAIVDAAEAILAEGGYDAATLKAVGERAGIPTASLYHYVADRHQLDATLAQRHLDQLGTRIASAVAEQSRPTLRRLIDTVIDQYLDYFREHPAFIQLWFGSRTPILDEMALTFDESQAEQFWSYTLERKLIAPDTPQIVVHLAFEAGNRLFDVAFRRTSSGDDTIIDEARRLIAAYLGTYTPRRSGLLTVSQHDDHGVVIRH